MGPVGEKGADGTYVLQAVMDNLEVSNAMLAHTRFSHILHGPFSWSEIEWDNDGNRRSPKEVTYLKAYIIYLIEHEKELNWDSMMNIRNSLLKGFPTMPAEHWKTLYNYLVGSHRDSLSDILELKYDLNTWRPNRAQRRYRKRHKEYARRKFDSKFYKTMRGLKRALDKQKEQPFLPPVPDGQVCYGGRVTIEIGRTERTDGRTPAQETL